MMKTIILVLATLSAHVLNTESFASVGAHHRRVGFVRLQAQTLEHAVEIVDGEDRVLDVASL
jgi:hypothetical protein